jgi:hypothetical protein
LCGGPGPRGGGLGHTRLSGKRAHLRCFAGPTESGRSAGLVAPAGAGSTWVRIRGLLPTGRGRWRRLLRRRGDAVRSPCGDHRRCCRSRYCRGAVHVKAIGRGAAAGGFGRDSWPDSMSVAFRARADFPIESAYWAGPMGVSIYSSSSQHSHDGEPGSSNRPHSVHHSCPQ